MIINKTEYEMHIDKSKIPKCPEPIEITTEHQQVGIINDGINDYNILEEYMENVKNLPDKLNNVYFIVTQKVKDFFPDRNDFIVPIVVNKHDEILQVKGFLR